MLGRQLLFVMGRDAGNEYAPTLLGSLPACINDADGVCTMVRPLPPPPSPYRCLLNMGSNGVARMCQVYLAPG
jgi:hypothetical protein